MIVQERLDQIANLAPKNGNHDSLEQGACVMELVAYVAGEEWSDAPKCACPVITKFCVSWNDCLPSDADHDRLLKPLVPMIVGTRSTPAVEKRRAMMAAAWLIRVYTPAWLRAAKLNEQANLVASLPEIADLDQFPSLMPALTTVQEDAAAARDAARDALKPTTQSLQASTQDLLRRMCGLKP